MPDLPRWVSNNGRIALLGDSAHAMLPNAAHGFSQIVEDIGVLEYLLQNNDAGNMAKVTDTWQSIRIPRVNKIKDFAAWNTRVFLGEEDVNSLTRKMSGAAKVPSGQVKSLKGLKSDSSAPFHTAAFYKWVQDYDAVGEARKHVEGLKAKI